MIGNSDESEFGDRPHEIDEVDELDLGLEGEWLDLDMSEADDDVSVVSDLFRQVSQETIVDRDAEVPEIEDTPEYPETELSPPEPQAQPRSRLLATGLAIALGITGLIALTRFLPNPEPMKTLTSSSTISQIETEFQNLDNPALTTFASQKLAQADLNGATTALETLLDRNALSEVKQVISAAPSANDSAEMSFLRGRLIWQSLGAKGKIAEIQSARKYWQQAVKQKPNSVIYRNALGFAYYAEKKFDRAIAVWFEAIDAAESSKLEEGKSGQKQVLNNYAGIALALWQVANTQPPAQEQQLTQEARKLGSKVISQARADFQPEKLAQDWMWTQTAIQDWRSFLKENYARALGSGNREALGNLDRQSESQGGSR